MPELIPNPIEVDAVAAGDACSVCWGSGKPFGDGDTPESISVNFSGVQRGPDWNPGNNEPIDGEFQLDQDGVTPCKFELSTVDWFISVEFTATKTLVTVIDDVMQFHFTGSSSDACGVLVFNEQNARYKNGSALVTVPEVT